MKKLAITILSVFLLSIFPVKLITQAEESTGTAGLNVYVKTTDDKAASGVNISLSGPSSYSSSLNTDTSGKSAFISLAAGDYTVVINLTEDDPYVLKTGESASKTIALADGETKNITFNVTDRSTSGGDETTVETSLALPETYTQAGSTSTNLTKYTDTQLKTVKNYTLHIPGYSKIVFKQTIDFSASKDKISQMDQFVFLQHPGQVSVATELAPELNKQATVTLYGLKIHANGANYEPVIMKDNQVASSEEVSNIQLIGTDTISFDVKHFSTYALKPTLVFENTDLTADSSEYTINGQVDDLSSLITITLNGDRLNQDIPIDNDGTFSVKLNLKKGENQVEVKATGITEQVDTVSLKIANGTAENNTVSSMLTLIIGGVLVVGGVAFGAFYYYRSKKKANGAKTNKIKYSGSIGNNAGYDTRLLTPEERRALANEKEIDTGKTNEPSI